MVNEIILDECLEDIRAGRATVDEVLSKYPDQANELAPLLKVALALIQVAAVAPSTDLQASIRQQLLELTHEPIRRKPQRRIFPWCILPQFRIAAIALVIIVVALAATGGTLAASNTSLPGTVLYPIKLASEQTQLFLAGDAASQVSVHFQIADNRLDESVALAELGQVELAERIIDEYDKEVDRTLRIVTAQPDEIPASIEKLTKGFLKQQEKLEKAKVLEENHGAVERAISISEKALKQLQPTYSSSPPSPSPKDVATPPPSATETKSPDVVSPTPRATPLPTEPIIAAPGSPLPLPTQANKPTEPAKSTDASSKPGPVPTEKSKPTDAPRPSGADINLPTQRRTH